MELCSLGQIVRRSFQGIGQWVGCDVQSHWCGGACVAGSLDCMGAHLDTAFLKPSVFHGNGPHADTCSPKRKLADSSTNPTFG